ncbi:MAG: response regulator [Anaerolineae bacterium]
MSDRLIALLRESGAGVMSNSAYDAAWLVRLGDIAPDLSEAALDWLRANQLEDGSWGTPEFDYHHERLVCTLAAMIALHRHGHNGDSERIRRAADTLEMWLGGFWFDPAGETIGFELLIPTLLSEAQDLGLLDIDVTEVMMTYAAERTRKLSRLPERTIIRYVTAAFSSELGGEDALDLLDVDHLQEANGSVAYSPAATAFFAIHIRPVDERALDYLRQVTRNGGAPNNTPIDIFEASWTLWNLSLLPSLDDELCAAAQPLLDLLEAHWDDRRGVGACSGFSLVDCDDTSVVFEVLTRFQREPSLEAVLQYEVDTHFLCFPMESNPSISTNIHVLGALHAADYPADAPSVRKVITFLRANRVSDAFWFDKWHASPYYPTGHAIISLLPYEPDLAVPAVDWLVETQNPDGSWGFYIPTAEETATCLQALLLWQRAGHDVPAEVVTRGLAWLRDHTAPPYPMLWIGKSLYTPEKVVENLVHSTLLLAEQAFPERLTMSDKFLAFVIEDDPDAANIARFALEADDLFAVEIINRGDKALERLKDEVPRVVILDLHLPKVEGVEILNYIRGDARFENTKVIVVTADPQRAVDTAQGAELILLKPAPFSQIKRLAERLVVPSERYYKGST